jgi:uncharacterized protein (TIGR02284 family)
MTMDKDDVIETLNDLIETCKDGELGFRDCAGNIRDPNVQQMLLHAADRCRQGADELQREVQLLGGQAETSGSLAGSAHRRWVDIKGAIMGKDEASVLAECERGEDVAKESYERALEEDLPANIRAIVERQYRGVLENHDRVRALERAAKSTS